MEVQIIDNITKEYPSMFKVVVYREPLILHRSGAGKRNEVQVEDDYEPCISSLYRTKTLIRDLVLCNDFDLFCTFTFDPDKVDRFSYGACYGKMSRFVHHQKERSDDFAYIIVPEQHKSGAWHFHALFKHFNGTLKDSKHKSSTGRPVYNITSFRSGFSTAVKVDSREGVAEYVTKYITKDFIRMFNKKRFFCSRNLVRPKKTINSDVLRRSSPLLKKKVSERDYIETYVVDKFGLDLS